MTAGGARELHFNQVTSLPVRVEPELGESWTGYTNRVAREYTVPLRTLFRHFLGRALGPAEGMALERTSGIAMTTQTTSAFGHFFRLAPHEVEGMHLTRFHGSALHVPDDVRMLFDPLQPPSPRRRWSSDLGPIWAPRRTASCPDCRRERPDHWPLTWRLRWHTWCLEHGGLISDRHDVTATSEISGDAIQAQQMILDSLTPSSEHHQFFAALGVVALRSLDQQFPGRGHPMDRASVADLAVLLPDLVSVAIDVPDVPATQHLPGPRPRRTGRSRNEDQTTVTLTTWHRDREPSPMETANERELARLPLLLPTRWFVSDLSDLSYPLPITQGRAAAALAVFLIASAGDLDSGRARYGRRLSGPTRLAQLLERLEVEGRVERYRTAAQAATRRVLAEGIDYQFRVTRLGEPELYDRLRPLVPAMNPNPLLLRTWLVDQWACTFTSTFSPRLSTTNGRLGEFNREYGPALARALTRDVGRVAG